MFAEKVKNFRIIYDLNLCGRRYWTNTGGQPRYRSKWVVGSSPWGMPYGSSRHFVAAALNHEL